MKNSDKKSINTRTTKGFGASHPFADRSATNLGKSKVAEMIDAEMIDSEKNTTKKETSREKVKISRAFKGASESVKISEVKIREIIKNVLKESETISEHEVWGQEWNHTHKWDDEIDYAKKTIKGYKEDVEDKVSDLADDAVKSGMGALSWLDDNVDYDYDILPGAGLDVVGAARMLADFFDSEAAASVLDSELIRSWERSSDPVSWLLSKKNREELVDAFKELDERELGEPVGSDYFDNIDNELTDSEDTSIFSYGDDRFIWSNKGRVLSSEQLKVNSAEEAIDKFYKDENLGSAATAVDFRGRSHSEYPNMLRWGQSMSPKSYSPQYIWLAKKLKDYGYNTKEKILKILMNWVTPGTYDPIGEAEESREHTHPDKWVSPFEDSSATGKALDEAEKIYREVQMLDSNPVGWKFKVYYCTREMEWYRDALDFQSNTAPYGTRWIFDALDFGADDAYQDCYLVHYTDDPRFLTGRGRMVFRIQK